MPEQLAQASKHTWTAPHYGVSHLTITERYETYTATLEEYKYFVKVYIYKHGSSEAYTYGPRFFFKGECIAHYGSTPNVADPVASAKEWAEKWIPR